MSKPTSRLGRGLNSMIAPRPSGGSFSRPAEPGRDRAVDPGSVRMISAGAIQPNPRQPRTRFSQEGLEQLAASIRSAGVLQPILVRPLPNARYELIAGERRWRAAQLAGFKAVPAMVREVDDAERNEIALIENLQREDLTVLERAGAYKSYLETFGVTIESLARRLGESRANVSNYLRLLALDEEILEAMSSGPLAMGHARALLAIEDPQRRLAVARMAIRRGLSVRQLEQAARPGATAPKAASAADGRHIGDVERSLSKALGLSVKLAPGRTKNSGRLIIRFRNLEEFERIAERIGVSAPIE